jgi:hypothetical protein
MAARLAGLLGKPFPDGAPEFADSALISDWAVDGVGSAQASGIVGGIGDNMFDPQGDYTREQSIVTMMRLYDYLTY